MKAIIFNNQLIAQYGGDSGESLTFCIHDGTTPNIAEIPMRERNRDGVYTLGWNTASLTDEVYFYYIESKGLAIEHGIILNNPLISRICDSIAVQSSLLGLQSELTITKMAVLNLQKIQTGRWKLQNNQLVIYDSDGVTPLLNFDLKDENGEATMQNVFERVPS